MSNVYPTLEDLKVDKLASAQLEQQSQGSSQPSAPPYNTASQYGYQTQSQSVVPVANSVYPSLSSYMGMDIAQFSYHTDTASGQVAPYSNRDRIIAPVSGTNAVGIIRGVIRDGVRPITLCKDDKGSIGLTLKDIDKGLFVAIVAKDSPAALAGLRFGDQILQIQNETVAGWSVPQTVKFVKKLPTNGIELIVRDRPLERTLTLNKDSSGSVGFILRDGRVESIARDSSAARNGLLINSQIVEVDGCNVVGLPDKDTADIMRSTPNTFTLTLMPRGLYEAMVKKIGKKDLKRMTERSYVADM